MVHLDINQNFMKRFTTLLSVLLGLSAWMDHIMPAQASVDIAVSPPYLEFEVGKQNRSQSLNFVNYGNKPIKVKVSIHNWMLDQKSSIKLIPPTEQSLDQWLIINPLEFTIPAQGQQTVRLGVRPRVQPELGEHRAMLYFDTEPVDTPKGTVLVKGRLGVAVYGYVGDLKRLGTLNAVTVSTNQKTSTAIFDITSNGKNNVRMKGQYTIWPAAQYPGASATSEIPNFDPRGEDLKRAKDPQDQTKVTTKLPKAVLEAGFLPSLPVLPKTQRQLSLQFQKPLPPGQYVLDLNGKLGEAPIDKGIPFVVNP